MDEVLALIDRKKYFLLHAPRQTGKTTCLIALMEDLNREGRYRAVYANLEGAQAFREQVDQALPTVVTDIAGWAHDWVRDQEARLLAREVLATNPPGSALGAFLAEWCARSKLPVVLIEQAKEQLILERVTHLDQLAHKLLEPRVRRVIEPMLAGTAMGGVPDEDIHYLIDLGLCRMEPGRGLTVANPIYREVLPRALAFTPQASLPQIQPTWLEADGRLNPTRLLTASGIVHNL